MLGTKEKKICIFLIVVIAFIFRFSGIFHDLPYTYFGDEDHFIKRSLSFGSGDLNPHWFHKPALYMYILFIEYGMYFLIGKVLGWFNTVDDFARHYFSDLSNFLIIGRFTTVLFGTASVYLTYVMGKKLRDHRVGIISALFIAFTFNNIYHSQVVKADIPATVFSIISIIFIFSMIDTRSSRDCLLASFFAGLGAATKYYTVVLVPSICLAYFIVNRENNVSVRKSLFDKNILTIILSFLGGFFIGSPYNFIDTFWLRINILPKIHGIINGNSEGAFSAVGHGQLGFLERIIFAVKIYFGLILSANGMGLFLGILAVIGIFCAVIYFDKKIAILYSYIITFFFMASLTNSMHPNSRHMSVMYPIFCLFSAVFIEKLFNNFSIKMNISNRVKNFSIAFLCSVVIFPGAYKSIQYNYRSLNKDTRLLAKEWFESNIERGEKILLDESGPKIKKNRDNIERLYSIAKSKSKTGPFTTHIDKYYKYQLEVVQGATYDVTEIGHPWWLDKEKGVGFYQLASEIELDIGNPVRDRGIMPFEYYKKNGYKYVITTSEDYDEYFHEPMKSKFPSFHHFYQDLFTKGHLIKEFRPHPWKRPGPVVKIFNIG